VIEHLWQRPTDMDITFHYPPELMSLLIDTIPLLNRSKKDVFLFFQGAGVPSALTDPVLQLWREDKGSVSKFEIVRQTLTNLNSKGESALRERREVLRRVVEFDNFSSCWDADRLKASGLVGEIRHVVNVKDSFTRMKEERDAERRQHISAREAEIAAIEKKDQTIAALKAELFALFAEKDPRLRGKALEGILNRLFTAEEILVREAFTLCGSDREGVVEQIDGVIELDNHLCFVEVKWWEKPVGVPEVSQHMMRVFLRAESRAIVISASDFTASAVTTCKEALAQKVVSLCTLQELVLLLERRAGLSWFLRQKMQSTIIEKNPFPKINLP
jgi:restriction system protein